MNKFKIKSLGLAVLLLSSYVSPALAADNLILLSPQFRTVEPIATTSSIDQFVLPKETLTPVLPLLPDTSTSTDTTTEPDPKIPADSGSKLTPVKPDRDLSTLRTPPGQEKKEEDKKDTGAGWLQIVQSMFTEYWVQMLALIVSVIGVILAISGFSLANKKKRKYLKKYLHEIDNVYSSFKWKSRRCEVELYRLQDQVEDHLKAGAIDENTYHLLEARIQKYLNEIKDSDSRQPRDASELQKEDGQTSAAKKLSDQIDEVGKNL